MININGISWELRQVSPFHKELNYGKNLGCCNTKDKIIYINEELKGYQAYKVLRHELAHAVLNSYNVQIPEIIEEMFADLTSTYGEEIIYYYDKLKERL